MEILSNPAVLWMIFGVVGLVLELVVPGLIIVFFGIGALFTSFGLLFFDVSLTIQLIIFFVISSLSLIFLRKSLKKKFFDSNNNSQNELEEEFIGKRGKAISDFSKGLGKIEFKGTTWNAHSESDISEGQYVEIISKESITLTVKPI